MSNYTKATNFATKDALTTGNPLKTLSGTELNVEFDAIATAVTTKANASNAALTGTPTAPTAAADTNTTQVATTAFVTTEAALKLDLAGGALTGALTTNSTIDGRDVAADGVLATNAMPKSGGAFSGAVTTNSTFDGRDVAADGVLATNALPKSGGAMTGAITTNSTFDGVDIATRDGVLTSTKVTADAALPKAGGTMTGDTLHGDNVKAKFGTGGDLEIYHNANTSYITESGSSNFKIGGENLYLQNTAHNENYLAAIANQGVTLYYNNATKLATTSTGIDVTGTVTADELLVAGTSTNPTGENVVGAAIDSSGEGNFSVDGSDALRLNRKSDDGVILRAMKDGTTVGSIGVTPSNRFYIGSGDTGLRFSGDTNQIVPWNTTTNSVVNSAIDLGYSGGKFKDAYLSGQVNTGTMVTTGNVLVGTTTLNTTSSAAGFNVLAGGQVWVGSSGGTAGMIHTTGTTGSNTVSAFYQNGSKVGDITGNGSSTSYNTSSDYRLKTDVTPMTGATATFKQLKPVNFEWIADGTRVDGFLAHELGEVIPAAATGTKDAMIDEEYEVSAAVEATYDNEGEEVTAAEDAVMATRSVPDMQGIDQSKVVPLLVATLQEALDTIEALTLRIEALEA